MHMFKFVQISLLVRTASCHHISCAHAHICMRIDTHTHTHTRARADNACGGIMCVCVSVCVRERAHGCVQVGDSKSGRQQELALGACESELVLGAWSTNSCPVFMNSCPVLRVNER